MSTPNFANRTLWTGDNLDIMRSMNSECVDLIYLDPPFNSKQDYAAPIGSEAAGAAFKDTWTLSDVDEAWHGEIAERQPALYAVIDAAGLAHGKGMKAYLIMMAVRLLEMRRLLKPAGSIYLHCDPTACHYLKMLMDVVFGKDGFRNEIVWCYTGPGSPKMRQFSRKHDIIIWYSSGEDWVFNSDEIRIPHKKLNTNLKGAAIEDPLTPELRAQYLLKGKVPETWWPDFSPVGRLKKERTGYPTQKPLALLDRIIRASSNPGDMILDPFCGCATALVAADRLERQWAGIDLSSLAAKLVLKRIREDRGPLFDDVIHRTDMPKRTDFGELPNYKTHRHTLYGRQEGICGGCLHHFPFRNMTVDHIVPKAKGGQDNIENLQLLCAACNSMKGTRTQEEFIASLKSEKIR